MLEKASGVSRGLPLPIAAVIAVLALVVTGWWGSKHVMWWTSDGHQIAQAVRGAASVNEALLTPPQAYRNVALTPAGMDKVLHAAQEKLADYYTEPELSSWRHIAARTLNPRDLHHGKDSSWMTNWRVDWIHLGELDILPWSASATATGSAEFRSNAGVINRVDYTWNLAKTKVGWRVDREDFQFEPGYGP